MRLTTVWVGAFRPSQIGKGKSMSTSNNDPAGLEPVEPVDPDLAEQAAPGHGVPSQDPSVAAQTGLLPEEAEREAKSAFVGGGAVAGLAAGAAVGAVVGGPIGVVVGGTVGTLVGALGGEAAGRQRDAEPPVPANLPPADLQDPPEEFPQR